MKLEIGRYYRTRDGRKVGPIYVHLWTGHCTSNYIDDIMQECRYFYLIDGRNISDMGGFREEDLIAEWTDATTGTLAELNVQVGDVVEWMHQGNPSGLIIEVPKKYTTNYRCSDIQTVCISNDDLGLKSSVRGERWGDDSQFRIVSRAQPTGPVITETVTHKRIVPGVYGKVDVGLDDGEWCVDLTHSLHGRADLIAARDVFNQLIDALADSSAT